jgi:hypothetical protein
MRTTLPSRTTAIAALQKAILEFSGYTGPGKWAVNPNGRNFIGLTYSSKTAWPESSLGGEPWDLYGGDQILAASGLKSDRTVSCQKSRSFFASAIIFVKD